MQCSNPKTLLQPFFQDLPTPSFDAEPPLWQSLEMSASFIEKKRKLLPKWHSLLPPNSYFSNWDVDPTKMQAAIIKADNRFFLRQVERQTLLLQKQDLAYLQIPTDKLSPPAQSARYLSNPVFLPLWNAVREHFRLFTTEQPLMAYFLRCEGTYWQLRAVDTPTLNTWHPPFAERYMQFHNAFITHLHTIRDAFTPQLVLPPDEPPLLTLLDFPLYTAHPSKPHTFRRHTPRSSPTRARYHPITLAHYRPALFTPEQFFTANPDLRMLPTPHLLAACQLLSQKTTAYLAKELNFCSNALHKGFRTTYPYKETALRTAAIDFLLKKSPQERASHAPLELTPLPLTTPPAPLSPGLSSLSPVLTVLEKICALLEQNSRLLEERLPPPVRPHPAAQSPFPPDPEPPQPGHSLPPASD